MKLLKLLVMSLVLASCTTNSKDNGDDLANSVDNFRESINKARVENRKKKHNAKAIRRYRIPKPRKDILDIYSEEDRDEIGKK